MKRGPLAWVHLVENRFVIVEARHGGFYVNAAESLGNWRDKLGGELCRTRSEAGYWRDKFAEIFKAGFITGMNYITNIPDKNQIDLFKVAE